MSVSFHIIVTLCFILQGRASKKSCNPVATARGTDLDLPASEGCNPVATARGTDLDLPASERCNPVAIARGTDLDQNTCRIKSVSHTMAALLLPSKTPLKG